MKEKLTSEINSGMKKGSEYTTKTTKAALSVFQSISSSVFGETTLVQSPEGRWIRATAKPGIKDLISIRRGSILR